MGCRDPKSEAKVYIVVCAIFSILEIAALVTYIVLNPDWTPNFSLVPVVVAIILSIISIAACYFLYRAIKQEKIEFIKFYMGYFVIKWVLYLSAVLWIIIEAKNENPRDSMRISSYVSLVVIFIVFPYRVLRVFWKIIVNIKRTKEDTNPSRFPQETNYSQ